MLPNSQKARKTCGQRINFQHFDFIWKLFYQLQYSLSYTIRSSCQIWGVHNCPSTHSLKFIENRLRSLEKATVIKVKQPLVG